MLDIIIRGGDVVTPQGVIKADVGVKGETIAAVTAPGVLTEAGRVIDAAGKIVMPGGVDPHVHMAHPFRTPEGVDLLTRGPDHVGMAALYGGTTTMLDFAYIDSNGHVRDGIESRDKQFAVAACDYAYHLMLQSEPAHTLMGELAEAIQAGYPTIKIFMTNIWPHRQGRMVDLGDMWEVFKVLAHEGGLGVIHAEDNDLVMHMYQKLIREGRTGFENMAEVHSQLSEDISFRRVIRLAESVPGCALYMMHVSAATGVAAIREARAKGLPIYGESLHQYMLYTADDYKRPNGQIYHTYPSLKSPADQAELWRGTLDGAINCVATDEICCTLAQKLQGVRIDDTTGGNAGVEPRVSLMFTEMVGNRGYSLNQFVDLVSTNAAKIMGLYPRKGILAAGSDADIVVLDPKDNRVLKAEDLHEADYTPWEGRKMNAWPCLTVLRGKVMVENGTFKGSLNDGKWQHRKVAEDMFTGPRL